MLAVPAEGEAWLEAPPKEKPELLAAEEEAEARPNEGVAWLLLDCPVKQSDPFKRLPPKKYWLL